MLSGKPHARVAGRTSRRIDGVDGVLTTHTQRGWVHAWTVTDGSGGAAPRPFAAGPGDPAWIAVTVMCAVVLTAAVVAVVVILDAPQNVMEIAVVVVGLVVSWMALLSIPAIARSRR